MVPPESEPVRGAVRADPRLRLRRPADRASQPHLLLRRAPAGVHREHALEARAGGARDRRRLREALRARDRPGGAPVPGAEPSWPSRARTIEYARRADATVERAIAEGPLEREDNPLLRRGLALYTMLEHEAMHQETLHYMWRRLPYDRKGPETARPRPSPAGPGSGARDGACPPDVRHARRRARRDRLRMGQRVPAAPFSVPEFEIGIHNVTNAEFLEFVEAGGYRREELWDAEGWAWVAARACRTLRSGSRRGARRWEWLGMFERIPLPPAWPVWVTQAEASAFARWKGCRLPTEAEYHRAAFGDPSGRERAFPWGDEPPDETRGNFDFRQWEPVAVGSYPGGRERVGNPRPRRQRMGVDVDGLRRLPGLCADGVLPAVLGGLLRRQALRHEGRVARDRPRARPAELPQLVPPELSARLRVVSVCGRDGGARSSR